MKFTPPLHALKITSKAEAEALIAQILPPIPPREVARHLSSDEILDGKSLRLNNLSTALAWLTRRHHRPVFYSKARFHFSTRLASELERQLWFWNQALTQRLKYDRHDLH